MKTFMSKRASFSLLLSVLALAMVLGGSVARADDLNLGGGYNTFNFYKNGVDSSEGGGPVAPSYLNSVELSFVYCVDIWDNVGVPADYPDTTVTHNAVVTEGGTAAADGETGGVVDNAGEVAWLLDTYVVGAESNTNAQIGLQAAIWTTIYGSNYYLDPTDAAGAVTDYNNDLAALAAATGASGTSLSNFDWFSPNDGDGVEQGLIGGNNGSVPEPASILLLGTLLLGVLQLLKRKLAPSQQ